MGWIFRLPALHREPVPPAHSFRRLTLFRIQRISSRRPSFSLIALALALVAAVAGLSAPATASGYSVYGSYLSPDDADETFGLGIRYTITGRSSSWGFDIASAFYDNADALVQVNSQVTAPDQIRLIPLDVGLRYTWRRDTFDPYVGIGGTFARLRSDLGEVDDETGAYAIVGLRFGDQVGASFFIEGQFRNLSEASVKLFPDQPEASQPKLDLSGFSVNLGFSWGI